MHGGGGGGPVCGVGFKNKKHEMRKSHFYIAFNSIHYMNDVGLGIQLRWGNNIFL